MALMLAGAATGPAVLLGHDRILAPGRWRWLRAFAWAVLLFAVMTVVFALASGIVIALLLLLTHQRSGFVLPKDPPPAILFAGLTIGTLAALALYLGLVRLGEKRTAPELAPRAALAELPLGLALGTAMMAVTVALMWSGGWVAISRQPVTAIWKAVAESIQSGILEELLFRLVVFRLLWRAFGIWAALALSALLFGALHLMNPNATPFAALCIAIEAGLMLAAFYILTGRLWVSIGVHAGWNFTQGWIFGAAVSGTSNFTGGPLAFRPLPGVSPILSGAGFGPEASLAGLAVGTAVGAFALHRAWKRGRFTPVD
ncbi:MAG TPA: CPBP family intramembrane glutamic endopeptidase [Allosphingosinicella sp.]|nr:CPBP family intramembrane glutamic endopeptidase [Allosphingosinicella sp.]